MVYQVLLNAVMLVDGISTQLIAGDTVNSDKLDKNEVNYYLNNGSLQEVKTEEKKAVNKTKTK